jgi:hypothetical protein
LAQLEIGVQTRENVDNSGKQGLEWSILLAACNRSLAPAIGNGVLSGMDCEQCHAKDEQQTICANLLGL